MNSVVDSALGYATTDLGPRWRQRQPVPINRWQTLLIKWGIIVVLTAVLTAVMLLVAWGVGMDMPYPWLLWAFTWLCALSVGIGTIALFAMAGNYGQLIGLLVFVYAGLASAGGTVPVEALPGFLRTLSYVEPLRQVLAGTRSILYFDAQGVAGLTRGTVAAAPAWCSGSSSAASSCAGTTARASTASGPRSWRMSTRPSRTTGPSKPRQQRRPTARNRPRQTGSRRTRAAVVITDEVAGRPGHGRLVWRVNPMGMP